MRKFLSCLFLLAILSPLALRADNKIVGTIDNNSVTAVVPFRNTSAASYTQSIYPQSEVGGAGTISAVAFSCSTPDQTMSADVKIYIGETTKTTHASSADWETLTLVYEGTGVVLGGEEWENFVFSTPYEYSGTNNLVIAVSSTNAVNMNLKWHSVSETGTKPSIHNTQAGAEPSGTTSVKGYRPVIKLEIEPKGDGGEPENPDPTPDPTPDPEPEPDPENPTDDTDAIGNGTINVFSAPIYNYGSTSYVNYAVSQQIYTAQEIGVDGGNISSISFHQAAGNDNVRDIVVYLRNTDKSSYSSTSDWVNMSDADVVYSGEFTFGKADEWVKIEFPTPFEYTGSNLVLTVCDNTGTNVGYSQTESDKFYSSQVTELRGLFKNGKAEAIDCSNLTAITGSEMQTGQWDTPKYAYFVNNIKLAIEKAVAGVEAPAAIDFGKVLLDEYWTEKTSVKFNVRAVNTTISNISVDNDFFVLPENIDYTVNPLNIDLTYNRAADVSGVINATLAITYAEGTKTIPVTATIDTPVTPDVYELAKVATFSDNTFVDAPEFANLNDNYILPLEDTDGNAPDAVYAMEFAEDVLLSVNVTGNNANFAIYDETFAGYGGPSALNSDYGYSFNPRNFFFDFSDGTTNGWTLIDKDGDGYNWEIITEGSYVYVKSYSYLAEKNEDETTNVLVSSANNVMMTEQVYNITPNSKLSFDAFCYSHDFDLYKDYINVEVTKDGETFTTIEKLLPAPMEFTNEIVDLGAAFSTLGLEYGDYYIVLRHKENDKMFVCLDNIRLKNDNVTRAASKTISEVYYPAGKYYLVAAAESAFTVNVETKEAPLAPPTEVAVTVTTSSVTLTWNAVDRAESYNIYRDDELLANVTETTFTEDDLETFTEYCYVIKSVAGETESFGTEPECVRTLDLSITTPVNVKAEAISQSEIKLTWDVVENAMSYNVYATEIVTTVTENTCIISSLQTYTNYCYSVTSVRNESESEKSEEVCARTFDLVPLAPESLLATPLSESTIALTWQRGENANSYNIYRDGELVATGITLLLHSDNGLTPNTEYCYVVKGVRNGVESEASNEACATTAAAVLPDAPENLDASAEAGVLVIYLTWDAVTNASSYNVYMNDEKIANVTTTAFTVNEGLNESTEYCFTVTTVVGELESLHSDEDCATTDSDGLNEFTASFNIYPNPVNDKLYIETEVEVEEVSIFDIYGRRQELSAVSCQPSAIDVSNLNSGVYFVKVVTNNGGIVKTFIKK